MILYVIFYQYEDQNKIWRTETCFNVAKHPSFVWSKSVTVSEGIKIQGLAANVTIGIWFDIYS